MSSLGIENWSWDSDFGDGVGESELPSMEASADNDVSWLENSWVLDHAGVWCFKSVSRLELGGITENESVKVR